MYKKDKKVIVFTTPSCSWCNKVKDYLKSKKQSFKEIDISRNADAARDIERKTGQRRVPVILIKNKPVVGFNKDIIDNLLQN